MIPMPIFVLIDRLIQLYQWVVIIWVVLSWLFAFGVLSRQNQFGQQVWSFMSALVEPVLRPIRRVVPVIGGFDLSAIALLLGLWFLQTVNWWIAGKIGF